MPVVPKEVIHISLIYVSLSIAFGIISIFLQLFKSFEQIQRSQISLTIHIMLIFFCSPFTSKNDFNRYFSGRL